MSQPEPAPEVIMDANGAYWRRYPDALSMCPVSTDNESLAEPVVVYRQVERLLSPAAIQRARWAYLDAQGTLDDCLRAAIRAASRVSTSRGEHS